MWLQKGNFYIKWNSLDKNKTSSGEIEELIKLWMTCKLDKMFSSSAMDQCTEKKKRETRYFKHGQYVNWRLKTNNNYNL